jgi:predicted TPR repeat methyltransferase
MDLSPAMIEQAQGKGAYDRLIAGDLSAFFGEQGAAQYHLVLAADVFVYCADLAPIAAGVARVLKPAGVFAFTVETHGGAGILLQPTLRYAHGEAHVRAAIQAASLQLRHLSPGSTRREKGEWVPGLAVVAATGGAPST